MQRVQRAIAREMAQLATPAVDRRVRAALCSQQAAWQVLSVHRLRAAFCRQRAACAAAARPTAGPPHLLRCQDHEYHLHNAQGRAVGLLITPGKDLGSSGGAGMPRSRVRSVRERAMLSQCRFRVESGAAS